MVGRKRTWKQWKHTTTISNVVTRQWHPPIIRHPHTYMWFLRVATRPGSHGLAQTTFLIVSCRCRSLCPLTHIIYNILAILYQATYLEHHTTLCVIATQLIGLYLSSVVGCHDDFDVKKNSCRKHDYLKVLYINDNNVIFLIVCNKPNFSFNNFFLKAFLKEVFYDGRLMYYIFIVCVYKYQETIGYCSLLLKSKWFSKIFVANLSQIIHLLFQAYFNTNSLFHFK